MYVRIARFEGGDPSAMDQVAAQVKEEMDAHRETVASGGRPEGWSDTRLEGTKAISRVLILADRGTGNGANIVFCDGEDDLRKADAMLNEMSPEGPSRRTSVEMYEVLLDEATH
jgi:prepilin-type processing-associated H-X9-DG protein